MQSSKLLTTIALAAGFVSAHPGHDINQEIAERRAYVGSASHASLAHCAEKLRARGIEQRNIARRSSAAEEARIRKTIDRRDLKELLSTSHNETDLGYTENTPASQLFTGNASCILTPEVTQGPYYVGGEYVRQDVTESQKGVDITLDYQVIDVDTCEPVPDVYVEIWHCNSTGVYSGVVANGNGDSSDSTNLDNTFLRGIQPTDSDGVAQFKSLFPGHYTGRATHIHVMVHTNATLYANQTLGNQIYASHVGQTFFDQNLITAVEKLEPYNTNTQELTTNAEDNILSEETKTDGVNPFMDYTYLGDSVADGLFAWVAFGINTTYTSEVTPAAFLYESGGVENPDSGMGGPGGGPPGGAGPSGGPPGGAAPSGAPPGAPPGLSGNSTASASETEASLTATSSVTPRSTPNAASYSSGGAMGFLTAITGFAGIWAFFF